MGPLRGEEVTVAMAPPRPGTIEYQLTVAQASVQYTRTSIVRVVTCISDSLAKLGRLAHIVLVPRMTG
jgi:hypothetical protein